MLSVKDFDVTHSVPQMGHKHCSHRDSTLDCDLFKFRKHLMHTGSEVGNLGPKTSGSS